MSLDAASVTLLAQVRRRGIPRFCHLTPSLARQASNAGIRPSSEPVAAIETVQVLSRPDGTSFAVRFVVPAGEVIGTVVYLHGGGWVVGSVNQAEPVARRLANRSGCTVALPDYSLAPERPYPCALDDVWRTLARVADGGNQSRPRILAGDSAGGNLAAVTAQRAAASRLPVALQVLVYPVLDTYPRRPSYLDPHNQLLLTAEDMVWFTEQYAPGDLKSAPGVAPLRADSLAGLPPLLLVQAEHDVLFDEGADYAAAVAAAGVPVTRRIFEGQMHGFFTLFDLLPAGEAAVNLVAAEIRRQLGEDRKWTV